LAGAPDLVQRRPFSWKKLPGQRCNPARVEDGERIESDRLYTPLGNAVRSKGGRKKDQKEKKFIRLRQRAAEIGRKQLVAELGVDRANFRRCWQGGGLCVSIGSEPLTRIGAEELTTLPVEALERQGWRRAAKRSAVRFGAAACYGWVRIGSQSTMHESPLKRSPVFSWRHSDYSQEYSAKLRGAPKAHCRSNLSDRHCLRSQEILCSCYPKRP
jgi:hypothetical protein